MSHPYSSKPGDEKMARGTVIVEKATSAAAPAAGSAVVTIAGSLPTPCHELRLRIPSAPAPDGVVRIEAWSVTDPDRMCAQVLHPFSVQVSVPAGADAKIEINGTPYGSIRP